jgi:oligopeptidase B
MASTFDSAGFAPALDTSPVPPVAERDPHATTIHGDTRSDDYFWLREKNVARVTAYLEAENAYADAVLAPTEALQRELYDEMLAHVKQTDLSVPYRLGAYYYYSRTEEGKQYPIYARKRESLDADEEVTLDLNAIADGYEFLGLGAYDVSDDGTLLAYALDTTGYRQYTLAVKDLTTGTVLLDGIERVTSVVWSADGTTLLYTTEDAISKRRDRFWRRALDAAEPVLVYVESDERYDVSCSRSRDRAYVFLASFSKSTTEWRALRSAEPAAEPTVIIPRDEGHRASVEHSRDGFFILTNRGAADFRLVSAPEATPDEAHWHEVVPERAGVHIEDVEVFENFAVLRGRSGGFGGLEILDLASGTLAAVELPETVRSVYPHANPEFSTDTFRFTYTSLVTPPTVFDLDMRTRERTLLKETEVPGYDRRLYTSFRERTSRRAEARRCCSTPTARTGSRWIRRFRRRGSRCSIAASASPSPTCGAAANSVKRGAPRATCRRSSIPLPISSPSQSLRSRRVSRRRIASRSKAGAPAAS